MRITEIWPFDKKPAKRIAHVVNSKCQPWLSQTNNGELYVYRGTYPSSRAQEIPKVSVNKAYIKNIRTDRRNKGMGHYRLVYNTMLPMLGAAATRENSACVNSNVNKTRLFGDPYIFLPIGEFHYTWSTEIMDWGVLQFTDGRYYDMIYDIPLADNPKVLKAIANSIEFDNNSLQKAIEAKHEILIHAESGLYISPDIYPNVLEELKGMTT